MPPVSRRRSSTTPSSSTPWAAVVDVDNNLTRYEPVAPGSTILRAIAQSGRHKRLVVKRGGVWRAQLFQNTMVAVP